MRAVVVSQWFPPEKAAIPADITHALVSAGHEVDVITGYPNYPEGKLYPGWRMKLRQVTQEDGFRLHRLALYPSHEQSAMKRSANYLSFALTSSILAYSVLRSADVIYVYHPPLTSSVGAWWVSRKHGVPYLIHVQDLWPDSVIDSEFLPTLLERPFRHALDAMCSAIYGRAAAMVAIAPTMGRILEDRGVVRSKLNVIPNWTDEDVFRPELAQPALAESLAIDGEFRVMFAGNLGHYQALDVAIRAAQSVLDLSGFRLVIVGSGVAEPELRQLADEIGARNVCFVGPQPYAEMSAVSALADVQLVSLRDLPFFAGTIPSKLCAAFAMAKPVVCAVAGDAASVVTAAGAGWTCPPEDVEALERAFRDAYAAGSRQLIRQGEQARAYYDQHLSRASGVDRIVRMMEQVGGAAAVRA